MILIGIDLSTHSFSILIVFLEAVFIIDFWSNSELIVYCKKEDFEHFGSEHSLVIMNHSYEIDWLVGWLLLEKTGGLGCTRGFIKNPIKYIPFAGWFFALAEHVFLQRSFDKDQKVLEEKLADFMTYPYSTWMVVTAEGTRFTKEKHEASFKFAQERNIEPFKYHLIPRGKGFMTCVTILSKHKCPALYSVQLAFDKDSPTKPTFGNLLMGKKVVAHVYIDRVPMERVEPTFECLHDIYKKKDALQDSFHKFGNFYEGRQLKSVEGMRMKPRLRVLINTIVWTVIVMSLMIYYSVKLILAGRIILLVSVSVGVTGISESSLSQSEYEEQIL
jgi:lysophosphatidic acid acyltransferase / lysophosphatidylinositol acyltransferase